MRTTLTLDDDVAALLERARKSGDRGLKELVNAALREGLDRMLEPAPARKAFRTAPHFAGQCYLQNLDSTQEILAAVEGEQFK